MIVKVPKLSLVILIGPSGCGKSTFARKHFLPTEIVSSDTCRGLVGDDENDQALTSPAFDLLHYMVEKRLEIGKLTVVDATNVQSASRKRLIDLAKKYHALPVSIAFKIDDEICHARNASRPDRQFGPHVVRRQVSEMRRGLNQLKREGFRHMYFFNTPEEVDSAEIVREKLWNDRTDESGPFDIIGDVHGCYEELINLLGELGYELGHETYRHPDGRRAVFVGDLVDRGPNSVGVLKTAMAMVKAGTALCVPGNHDIKLMRKLKGADVTLNHGLAGTVAELDLETEEFRKEVKEFIDSLVSHFVFDEGKLVVAHAGMPESMQGRGSGRVREFALYGETTGETDEFGLPIRYQWAADYRGRALVVYGHTPVVEAEWLNSTVCIDTGCVFGGKLTAFRYPEKELVSVPARATYAERMGSKPDAVLSSQHEIDDILDIEDVRGRQRIQCGLMGTIIIEEENSSAALETMSRFAANPKWLVYLPPTMSPCETSKLDGFLEHPLQAFEYFRSLGIPEVVCEEKHMGSRAVVVVCRDEATALSRFGVEDDGIGIVTTRTGRRFFDDKSIEQGLLHRLVEAMNRTGFWEKHKTNWAILDCELMPWSAKAQELLRLQYAPVGASATAGLGSLESSLSQAAKHLDDPAIQQFLETTKTRREAADLYVESYRRYCWSVTKLEDYKLAPFHVLATEGAVHADKRHDWHMNEIHAICASDPDILRKTQIRVISTLDDADIQSGVDWWMELTGSGGEGMVVKPMDFVARGLKGLVQPAVKCRGQEYLRIIYGPEYLLPENLDRLRKRGLGRKRALAAREFALGIEALERFVRREPLRRVHQCVFGVLALESEPVDPRL